MLLLRCDFCIWAVSVSVRIHTSGESRNTDGDLATAFLAEGDSPHSQFDKSQPQTLSALGTKAYMSLFSIFLPVAAVAASCTWAGVCD